MNPLVKEAQPSEKKFPVVERVCEREKGGGSKIVWRDEEDSGRDKIHL